MIPTRAWKLGAIGEPWQGGETVITAIGQGFDLVARYEVENPNPLGATVSQGPS